MILSIKETGTGALDTPKSMFVYSLEKLMNSGQLSSRTLESVIELKETDRKSLSVEQVELVAAYVELQKKVSEPWLSRTALIDLCERMSKAICNYANLDHKFEHKGEPGSHVRDAHSMALLYEIFRQCLVNFSGKKNFVERELIRKLRETSTDLITIRTLDYLEFFSNVRLYSDVVVPKAPPSNEFKNYHYLFIREIFSYAENVINIKPPSLNLAFIKISDQDFELELTKTNKRALVQSIDLDFGLEGTMKPNSRPIGEFIVESGYDLHLNMSRDKSSMLAAVEIEDCRTKFEIACQSSAINGVNIMGSISKIENKIATPCIVLLSGEGNNETVFLDDEGEIYLNISLVYNYYPDEIGYEEYCVLFQQRISF